LHRSIFEEGHIVVQARAESLEDSPNIDANLFQPTPEMAAEGGSFTLASPNRFPLRVDPSDAPTSTFFQPMIVHAIPDAEVLRNSDRDLSRAAMDLVKSTSFLPSGFQQEVFINVQFHRPAAELGEPPIFRSSVRWVIWEHRQKAVPARVPSRSGK
jgi:hypothetical protein